MSNSVDLIEESGLKITEFSSDDEESDFEIIKRYDESESDSDGSIIELESIDALNLANHKEQKNEEISESALNSNSSDSDSSIIIAVQSKHQLLHPEQQESKYSLFDLQNTSDADTLSKIESINTDTDSNDSNSIVVIELADAVGCQSSFASESSSDDERSYRANNKKNVNNGEQIMEVYRLDENFSLNVENADIGGEDQVFSSLNNLMKELSTIYIKTDESASKKVRVNCKPYHTIEMICNNEKPKELIFNHDFWYEDCDKPPFLRKRKVLKSSLDLAACRCYTCFPNVVLRKKYQRRNQSQRYKISIEKKYGRSSPSERSQTSRVSFVVTTSLFVIPFVILLNYWW